MAAGGEVLLVHDDGRFFAGVNLPVVAGSVVMASQDFQVPDGCLPISPLAGFNVVMLHARVEDVRAMFRSMRGTKHDHIEGIVADYSWRKHGDPRISPRDDMLHDISTLFHNFEAKDA